jgi:hypothetical protein
VDIGQPLRELGACEVSALRDAILGQADIAWHEDESRQKSFEVHDQTRSIMMIALDDTKWPGGATLRGPGWRRLADVALPVMQDIIGQHYPAGGEVIRAIAARLVAGANIRAHTDMHPSFHCAHRIHVPITTNPKVWFTIDGRPYQFEPGQAYEINNQKQHSVVNKGTEDRITFIFDYIPPGPLACDPGAGTKRPADLSMRRSGCSFRIPPEARAVAGRNLSGHGATRLASE